MDREGVREGGKTEGRWDVGREGEGGRVGEREREGGWERGRGKEGGREGEKRMGEGGKEKEEKREVR